MSTFILTASGAEYHLGGPRQRDNDRVNGAITIEIVAHSLSQINRFTGHAIRPYSVAEHSLLCVAIAEQLQLGPWVRLSALMHDAHEAYVGDASSPAKWELGAAWTSFEDTHARSVRRCFGLHEKLRQYADPVKLCDLMALATERRDLLLFQPRKNSPWPVLDRPGMEVPAADWIDLNTLKRKQRDWTEWRELFLEKYHELRSACADSFGKQMRESLQ